MLGSRHSWALSVAGTGRSLSRLGLRTVGGGPSEVTFLPNTLLFFPFIWFSEQPHRVESRTDLAQFRSVNLLSYPGERGR